MSAIPTDLQGTVHVPLDADQHPAESHLQDLRDYAAAWTRYLPVIARHWVACANTLEAHYTNPWTIPVLATVLGIFGAAIIGVNL